MESADDLADQTNIEYGTIHAGSTMTFFQVGPLSHLGLLPLPRVATWGGAGQGLPGQTYIRYSLGGWGATARLLRDRDIGLGNC